MEQLARRWLGPGLIVVGSAAWVGDTLWKTLGDGATYVRETGGGLPWAKTTVVLNSDAIPRLRPGASITVYVDPNDREEVAAER
jgi:hypothetical protein